MPAFVKRCPECGSLDLHYNKKLIPTLAYNVYISNAGWVDTFYSVEDLEDWHHEYIRKREIKFRNFGYKKGVK